jgi:cell division protein FtsB
MNMKFIVILLPFSVMCFGGSSSSRSTNQPLSASTAKQAAFEQLRADRLKLKQESADLAQQEKSVDAELAAVEEENSRLWKSDAGVLRKQINKEKAPLIAEQNKGSAFEPLAFTAGMGIVICFLPAQ